MMCSHEQYWDLIWQTYLMVSFFTSLGLGMAFWQGSDQDMDWKTLLTYAADLALSSLLWPAAFIYWWQRDTRND